MIKIGIVNDDFFEENKVNGTIECADGAEAFEIVRTLVKALYMDGYSKQAIRDAIQKMSNDLF